MPILENLNNPLEELQILNNIGDAYFNLGLYDKAKEVFEKNLNNPQSDVLIKVVSTKNIGKVYFKKKDFVKAKEIFHKVSALADEHDMPIFSIASDHFLGSTKPANFQYSDRARNWLQKK